MKLRRQNQTRHRAGQERDTNNAKQHGARTRAKEKREKGSTTAEIALVLPAVLAFCLITVQAGIYFFAYAAIDGAAAEALETAQAYSNNPDIASEAGNNAASSFLSDLHALEGTPKVSVTRGIDTVTVHIAGEVPSILPGIHWKVAKTVHGPIEQFLFTPERDELDFSPKW